MAETSNKKCTMGEGNVVREDGAIDMIAFAREATIRDQMGTYAGSVKVIAPAKVNLLLNVGPKREDGYHSVDTILHALMLHDVMYIRTRPLEDLFEGPGFMQEGEASDLPEVRIVCVGCDGVEPPAISSEENIVYRAVRLLAEKTGNGRGQCIEVRLEKHIPYQAGLGGGSSDAAAALVGVAKIWDIPSDDERIRSCAEQLGADVAFFLDGGCARYSGVGEHLEKKIDADKTNVLLVKPDQGLSTAEVYRMFDEDIEAYALEREIVEQSPEKASEVLRGNNLGKPAYKMMPALGELEEWLRAQPCVDDVLLCGSGSTLCVFCDSFQSTMRLSAAVPPQGYWTRATTLANLRASVVPRR